ncbi:MAG: response regulator [Vicinamibacterales bacterium]
MTRPASILIVDDEVIIARDLEVRLTGLGYTVAGIAATGRDAIRLARDRRPDLVLMDIVLKGDLDGIDAAAAIRRERHTPIVYLTAYTDQRTLDRAKRTQPFGYIVKPFGERELHANLEMALYRSAVEERLRRVEQWLAGSGPAPGDGMIAADAQGRITGFSDAAAAITGWPAAAALGRPLEEVLRLRDRETGHPLDASATDQPGPTVCLADETVLLDAEGARVPVDVTTSRRRAGGSDAGTVTFLRDPSGERYGALAALTGEIALATAQSLTLDGMLHAAAEAFVRHLDVQVALVWTVTLTGRELVLNARVGEPVPFEEQVARLPFATGLAGHIAETRLPVVSPPAPPESLPEVTAWMAREGMVAVAGHPLLVGDRLVGVLIVYGRRGFDQPTRTAITASARSLAVGIERKRLEEQLLQSQRMEAVGRLAGGVAHDFNNLLTVISGCAALVLEQPGLPANAQHLVREIAKAGQHAGGLTRRLLLFSRNRPVEARPLALDTVVRDLERMLRRTLGGHVQLQIEQDGPPASIVADTGQIEQVLINLAINARDAMPDGGTLTISTGAGTAPACVHVPDADAAEPWAVLRVRDTGVGMPPGVAARVFEPFFTTKDAGRGTGLGLATVYGIISQLGGHIGLDSAPGQGSTFHVCLPLHPEAIAPRAVARPAGPAWPRGTETVLLAEDEEVVRKLAEVVLEQCGYHVISAVHGRDAIARARSYPGPIHLLLSDVVMPEGTGRVVAETLRAARPGLRVLYMSGFTDDMVPLAASETAGTSFLAKPFLPDQLAVAVRRALDT